MRALLRNALLLATMSPCLFPVAAAASIGDAAAAMGEPEPGARNPGLQDLGALVDRLAKEVRELKLDLLEQQIEAREEKVARLERELKKVQIEQASLEDKERSLREDALSQQELLTEGAATEDQRAELQAISAQIDAAQLQGLRNQRRQIEERERDVIPQLEQERAKLKELLAQAQEVKSPSARPGLSAGQ